MTPLSTAGAGLREALEKALKHYPTSTIACNGSKCRMSWCESCWGDEYAGESFRKAMEEKKRAEEILQPNTPSVSPSPGLTREDVEGVFNKRGFYKKNPGEKDGVFRPMQIVCDLWDDFETLLGKAGEG